MTKEQAVETLKQDFSLHISYSQIFTYIACPLRWKFQYLENRPQERVSVNLFMGSAIHSAVSRYYESVRAKGQIEPLGTLQDLFEEVMTLELDDTRIPIIFKKEAPDRDSAINLGRSMVEAFYNEVDLTGYKVVGVELPLAARLFTDEGTPTDLKVVGIIDVLLRDERGELLVIDYKTAARVKDQASVNQDLQFSSYSYLICAGKLAFPTQSINCRMDVILKTKQPRMAFYKTIRTAEDRRRFAKIAANVLAGIEGKVFYPQPSFLCSDCSYQEACRNWL
jgi:putative RecB family exonuclease